MIIIHRVETRKFVGFFEDQMVKFELPNSTPHHKLANIVGQSSFFAEIKSSGSDYLVIKSKFSTDVQLNWYYAHSINTFARDQGLISDITVTSD